MTVVEVMEDSIAAISSIGLPGGAGAGDPAGREPAEHASRDLRQAAALMSDAQRIANFGSWEWELADDS